MKWAELKRAAEHAGIQDDDNILVIECQMYHGDQTLQKVQQGNFVRLIENTNEEYSQETGADSIS